MPMSMDPYGGEFQGFGKPCTKSKYSSKYSSGSGFKLITDGVIFQGKNSPRSYSKGFLLIKERDWLAQSKDLIRESRKTMMETEDLGVSALQDLSRHRQTFLHSHSKLDGVDEDELSRLSLSSFVVLGVISHTAACGVGLLWRESINNSRCRHNSEWLHNIRSISSISDLSTSPSKEIAGMIKQKLVETEHSSLSGAVPAFDGRKNIYSPVEFQEDRLEFLANLPISSCNT
ncbi:hypothetical protein HID58_042123 [Brassica napus]|uniref:Uncharacterized protein n=1 Tax=Brassica napus TaxID=3708 RepID=A0ABQ8BED8_BRANA|nr:hypothetical protein HID58_042123 [Brassica napus]